jgi:tyrosinase
MSLSISTKQACANPSSWKINLGPIQTTAKGVPPNPQADGLGYNPRCLSRDINTQASKETTDDKVVDLLTNYPDILSFQNKMQNFTLGVMGVHNGGHYTIGGDSGMDMCVFLISIKHYIDVY